MTTVAYDGRTLASDSQTTQSDIRLSLIAEKIHTRPNGITWRACGEMVEAFGVAGKLQGYDELVRELESHQGLTSTSRFTPGTSLKYLVITTSGKIYCGGQYTDDTQAWMAEVQAPIAVGSGAEFAMGAMAAGAPADAAVRIAMRFDVGTGGEVKTHTVR